MYWVSFDVMLRSTNFCKWSDVNLSRAGSEAVDGLSDSHGGRHVPVIFQAAPDAQTTLICCCLCSLYFSTEQRRLHAPSTHSGFKNNFLALRLKNSLLYFQRINPHCPESTAVRNRARGKPTDQMCSVSSDEIKTHAIVWWAQFFLHFLCISY